MKKNKASFDIETCEILKIANSLPEFKNQFLVFMKKVKDQTNIRKQSDVYDALMHYGNKKSILKILTRTGVTQLNQL